jgi:hypothetical protein
VRAANRRLCGHDRDLEALLEPDVALDVIAAGTPAAVGLPEGRFLTDGMGLVTRIEGLGECRNVCRAEDV